MYILLCPVSFLYSSIQRIKVVKANNPSFCDWRVWRRYISILQALANKADNPYSSISWCLEIGQGFGGREAADESRLMLPCSESPKGENRAVKVARPSIVEIGQCRVAGEPLMAMGRQFLL